MDNRAGEVVIEMSLSGDRSQGRGEDSGLDGTDTQRWGRGLVAARAGRRVGTPAGSPDQSVGSTEQGTASKT